LSLELAEEVNFHGNFKVTEREVADINLISFSLVLVKIKICP